MITLEKKFYSLIQIKRILGKDRKGEITGILGKWGYGFVWEPRRGVTITSTPSENIENPKEELKSFLIRKFGLDARTNFDTFAAFCYKMMDDEFYLLAPWDTKSKILEEEYGIQITEKTLRNYIKNFIKEDMVIKDKTIRKDWYTTYKNGEKIQNIVNEEEDIKKMNEWYDRRNKYLKEVDDMYENGDKNPNRWKIVLDRLWRETGVIYYKVYGWTLNGFADEENQELYRLCTLVVAGIEEL